MTTRQSYVGKANYANANTPAAQNRALTPSTADNRQPVQTNPLPPDLLTGDPVDSDEVWRPFPGYEYWYEVSNMGRVRTKDGLIVPLITHPYGFECVCLKKWHGKKLRAIAIQYAVAEAFLPNPGFLFVRHLDDDKKNNVVSNLAWDHLPCGQIATATDSFPLTTSTPPSHE